MEDKTVKILVGYHKPATLIKSDIFVPIHLGRALATEASKDGKISEEDYQWMLDNMIGDNTGDNISSKNIYLNELTGIYWAWKNYDKLGNPDYIGFMHYRRHLCFDIKNKDQIDKSGLLFEKFLDNDYLKKYKLDTNTIKEIVTQNDIVVGEKSNLEIMGTKTCYNHYKTANPYLHIKDLEYVINILKTKYPDYSKSADEYLNSKFAYFTNLFIMKKELFFEYCEWLFDIIFSSCSIIDEDKYNIQEIRVLAYISEWLFGIFFTYKKSKSSLKITELKKTFITNDSVIKKVSPINQREISIVFSSDENYAPYLAVSIKSLIEHTSAKNQYAVYVLDGDISEYSKIRIKSLETQNVKIKFINIAPYLNKFDKDLFYICEHFSVSNYFRFFIPDIFSDFKKVIYCDCDGIFLEDPARLYYVDLEDKLLGVVRDTEAISQIYKKLNSFAEYSQKILKLKNPYNYFNSGLLLMNIPELLKFDFVNKCINCLKEIKKPKYVDQCILNAVCENKVKFLDSRWNVENHLKIPLFHINIYNALPYNIMKEYTQAIENPYFLHFTTFLKPWQEPSTYNANLFWKYAKMTPFYEEIIYKNTRFQMPVPVVMNKKFYKNFMQRIFSVRNLKTETKIFKVITILGIKIKFKKRRK